MQKEPALRARALYQVAGALVSNLEVKAVWEFLSNFASYSVF